MTTQMNAAGANWHEMDSMNALQRKLCSYTEVELGNLDTALL